MAYYNTRRLAWNTDLFSRSVRASAPLVRGAMFYVNYSPRKSCTRKDIIINIQYVLLYENTGVRFRNDCEKEHVEKIEEFQI